jgi:hypothetical protein
MTDLDVGRRLVEADGDLLGLIEIGQELLVLLLLRHPMPVVPLLSSRCRLLGLLVFDLEGRGGLGVAHEMTEQFGLLKQIVESANTGVFGLVRRLRGGRS